MGLTISRYLEKRCRYTNSDAVRCESVRLMDSDFCTNHRCKEVGCVNPADEYEVCCIHKIDFIDKGNKIMKEIQDLEEIVRYMQAHPEKEVKISIVQKEQIKDE